MPIGRRLYLSVLSLFIVFALAFILFQQAREKQYKVDRLNIVLQDYNNQMHESLLSVGKSDEKTLDNYVKSHAFRGQRVTLIKKDGTVFFDNVLKNYQKFTNHSDRPEVIEALEREKEIDLH